MKFLITMNMPAYSGGPIHQIICEYPAKGVADFCGALERNDFIVVEEFYREREVPGVTPVDPYYSVGLVGLNHRVIGKVKELSNSTFANRKPRAA